ncbi:ribonuclease III [Candidatus Termititenax persephonae]|uniref:Ribonuclease 3 n=1 Tax=Candidatus Termititenax persephonae TaxID=2218525 RepID=A0A388TIQ5_9BACT|nr:ribonuclease III [Candidatus Termititenax persephonae]
MPLTLARVQQLKDLQKALQIEFQNLELLDLALTHCSYSARNNERLEFLGDAVLKIVISEYLFQTFPDQDEGSLTKIRAVLVSDSMLAEIGARFAIGRYLLMSRNESGNGGAVRKSNLADSLEALLAACYLDGGLAGARQLILRIFQPIFAEEIELADYQDYKSILQERVQALGWKLPEYRVIQESGPEHNKVFTSEVSVSRPGLLAKLRPYAAQGGSKTKKGAEQQAAKNLLQAANFRGILERA